MSKRTQRPQPKSSAHYFRRSIPPWRFVFLFFRCTEMVLAQCFLLPLSCSGKAPRSLEFMPPAASATRRWGSHVGTLLLTDGARAQTLLGSGRKLLSSELGVSMAGVHSRGATSPALPASAKWAPAGQW